MPAGIEVFNEFGTYQIDGLYRNPGLLRKGSGTTTRFISTDNRTSIIWIPLAAGEILAWRCVTDSVFSSRTSTQAQIHVRADAGALVEWWVFGSPTAVSNFGLQVFGESGERIFDSSEKPLRVVGQQGNGLQNYSDFSSIATIQMSFYVRQIRATGGVPPAIIVFTTLDLGVVRVSGTSVNISTYIGFGGASAVGSPPADWAYDENNGALTRHLIIDVTDY